MSLVDRMSGRGLRNSRRRRRAQTGAPVILCVDLRGPIETLVRLVAAGCTVREAMSPAEVEDHALAGPSVVIYDVAGPSARAVREAMADVPRIAVVPQAVPEEAAAGEDRRLREPFGAPALTSALTSALGRTLPGSQGDAVQDREVAGSFAIGRLIAVAAAAVLELTVPPVGSGRAIVLAVAFAFVGWRTIWTQIGVGAVAFDLIAGVGLIYGTGFIDSPYLLIAVVVAVEVGYRFGIRIGVPLASLVGAGLLAGTVPSADPGETAATAVIVSFGLLPMAAGAGALAARVRAGASDDGQRVLVEMNRTLERLAHQAQILPGGLEVGTVSDQALVEIRETLGAEAGMVLVGEGELLRVVGAFGVPEPVPTALRRDDPWWEDVVVNMNRPREAPRLPGPFATALPQDHVWLAPLRRGAADVGLLIACGSRETLKDTRKTSRSLEKVAVEISVALDNARLFELVRELSVDRERRRIARDLHDGVVQTLVHVGFELDLLARDAARTAPAESAGLEADALRLRKVMEGSVREVRATISDLRSGRASEGLVSALREHLRDLRVVEGPRMVLESTGYEHMAPEVEHELFRVAQEAISNAVQHAGAKSIRVAVRATLDGKTMLLIEDDGKGMPSGYGSSTESNRGVGMRSMRERAALLGARFQVDSKPGDGTRIIVEVPRTNA